MKHHSPDKFEKATSLSNYLRKYQKSPRNISQSPNTAIEDEDLKLPKIPKSTFKSGNQENIEKQQQQTTIQYHKKEQLQHFFKDNQNQYEPKIANLNSRQTNLKNDFVDDDEQLNLLLKCSKLVKEVENLKQNKYDHAINEYISISQHEFEKDFQQMKKKIQQKYEQKITQVVNTKKAEQLKLARSGEDILKYANTYQLILNELKERKAGVQKQYEESIVKVNQHKQKLITQWKRNSNEQAKKALAAVSLS